MREREREREIEREKEIHWLPLVFALTRDGNHNPGTCPDPDGTPNLPVYGTMLRPPERHWPGHNFFFFIIRKT